MIRPFLHCWSLLLLASAADLWPQLAFDPDGELWCAYDFGSMKRQQRGVLVTRLALVGPDLDRSRRGLVGSRGDPRIGWPALPPDHRLGERGLDRP